MYLSCLNEFTTYQKETKWTGSKKKWTAILALVETIANSFQPEMLMQGGVFFNLITFDNSNGSFLFF